jgi:hypothetical protein
MPLSPFHFVDAKTAKFLDHVTDSALHTALEERSPPNATEIAIIRRDLARVIAQAYAEGERNPAVLKRVGLLTLWLKAISQRARK